MKKIIYVILGIFLMVACTDDHLEELPTTPTEKTGEKVKVTFSVQIPEANSVASRSFSEPVIKTLQLAVFDANGYLRQAPMANRAANETGLGTAEKPIQFSVELNQTPNKCVIHFLANKTIDANNFGTESELIGTLYTQGTDDAYWQRVELLDGIAIDTENGINTIGNKLTQVPLIRNFAKITVTADNVKTPGNVGFTLLGYTVVNVPDRGTVAPLNTSGGGFAQYLDANKEPFSYSELIAGGRETGRIAYTGFLHSETEINENVAQDTNEDPFFEPNYTFYMYERNNQSQNVNRTYVIVKGKFGTDTSPSYYKIDLTYRSDNEMLKFEILRNFHYNIVIKNVEASGKGTPKEASEIAGSHNDLSASVETQSLLNISDGVERLFVSHTEYVFVSSEETMYLKYRYVPDVSQPNTEENELTDSDNDGYYVSYSLETKDNAEMNAVTSITPATSDDSQGWRTLEVVSADMHPGGETNRQVLTLTAGNLSRTVTFYLRPKYNFSNERATSPQQVSNSDSYLKATFKYSFTIPNNIAESLFPLSFIVQADPENIYPNTDKNLLPVKVLEEQQTFGYERVVTLEEYQLTGGVIDCYFRVNTENYVGTKITVNNRYFNDCEEVTLKEGTKITVQESDGNNDKILTWNTTATSIANQTVTISLNNSSVTWDYSLNNENFEVRRNGNQLIIRPSSIENDVQTDLTITTSDDATETINLQVISNMVLKIPANNLRGSGNGFQNNGIYNQSFSIYMDNTYNNPIGNCSFDRSGTSGNRYYPLTSDLELDIPAGVKTLYFVYVQNNYNYTLTYEASISIEDLKKAANGEIQTMDFNLSY